MHCLLSMWRINWWLRDSKVSPPDMATFSRGQRQTKELSKLGASGSQGFTLQGVHSAGRFMSAYSVGYPCLHLKGPMGLKELSIGK